MNLTLPLLTFSLALSSGLDLYVSPTGDDSSNGQQTTPLKTLAKAQAKARSVAGQERITITLADGIYYLADTLKLESADSGRESAPITYQAENEGGAILSGGSQLDLSWEPYEDGIYQAKAPVGLEIDQLFINGENQRMARYPNYNPKLKAKPYQGYSADAFSAERAKNWADPAGGYIHAMHVSGWGGYHYLITGKDAKGDVTYKGGWQNNRQMGMHKDHRMVENIFEELDAPGEWFHNTETNTLYYYPSDADQLDTAKVEVVRLRHLVELAGTEEAPVSHLTFKGFVIRHTARTFMDTKEPMVRSDWTIYRGGAFLLTGTEQVSILDCEFDQVGGNAIFINNYNRGTLVKGCHIHHTGASGVCFVGDPNAVRDPLFEYAETNDLNKIDLTVGPKTNNYPAEGEVADCLITNIGTVERQPAGIQMEMAAKITVRDCSVYDCARAGINIGDGAWGGHLIERVDVFDTVLETHDHGSFNSWGRDRFWRNDHLSSSQKAVDANPELPFLDAMNTTVIRDSRWRCDHGWDIDLDDGSSNYDLYNNLMLNKGLKLREGYRRHAWNNIAPFGSLHPHVWFQGSKDQVYANIFAKSHSAARMKKPYTRETMVDKNLFTSDSNALNRSKVMEWDSNSILGNADYINPAEGDFRVKDGSPALALGFKNFDMSQFGVKKESLKAIARTPEIPVLKQTDNPRGTKPKPYFKWLSAELQALTGEDFSAFGVSKENGGLAVNTLAPHSPLSAAGVKEGDLIQKVNETKVTSIAGLKSLSSKVKAPIKLSIIRNQQMIEIEVNTID